VCLSYGVYAPEKTTPLIFLLPLWRTPATIPLVKENGIGAVLFVKGADLR